MRPDTEVGEPVAASHAPTTTGSAMRARTRRDGRPPPRTAAWPPSNSTTPRLTRTGAAAADDAPTPTHATAAHGRRPAHDRHPDPVPSPLLVRLHHPRRRRPAGAGQQAEHGRSPRRPVGPA